MTAPTLPTLSGTDPAARLTAKVLSEGDPRCWTLKAKAPSMPVVMLPMPADRDIPAALAELSLRGRVRCSLMIRANQQAERARLGLDDRMRIPHFIVNMEDAGHTSSASSASLPEGPPGRPSRSPTPTLPPMPPPGGGGAAAARDDAAKAKAENEQLRQRCERIRLEREIEALSAQSRPAPDSGMGAVLVAMIQAQAQDRAAAAAEARARDDAQRAAAAAQEERFMMLLERLQAPAQSAPIGGLASQIETVRTLVELAREVGGGGGGTDWAAIVSGVKDVVAHALPAMPAATGPRHIVQPQPHTNGAAAGQPRRQAAAEPGKDRVARFVAHALAEAQNGSDPSAAADALETEYLMLPAAVRSLLSVGAEPVSIATQLGAWLPPDAGNALCAVVAQSDPVRTWLREFLSALCSPAEEEDEESLA